HGVRPSVYFLAEANQTIAFDDAYTDPVDPILNGHRSVAWMYRSLKFMMRMRRSLRSARRRCTAPPKPTTSPTPPSGFSMVRRS
ncbi:MAG TPA: hypothetical protein VJN39_04670, partial [Gemmatimonadales bacterium]|nr:hypothetical protein [Gemmatimonadales bacterium]